MAGNIWQALIHGGGVFFMTPCHATPFHSHVHRREVQMRILACPPMPPGQLDESDRFLENPVGTNK